jgi:hypothetical protein
MSRRQIFIGYTTEGTTDNRFLASVIQRTFEEVGFECRGEVDVLPVQFILVPNSNFIDEVIYAAVKAEEIGLMVLCVHADADDKSDEKAFKNKIEPAFLKAEIYLKNLVAVVPVRMTEAWMLADTELIKKEIGTSKSDKQLCLDGMPESFIDPKEIIKEAINIAFQNLPRRRLRPVMISDLYSLIGQKISLDKLARLRSYRKFKEAVRCVYQKLNYMG